MGKSRLQLLQAVYNDSITIDARVCWCKHQVTFFPSYVIYSMYSQSALMNLPQCCYLHSQKMTSLSLELSIRGYNCKVTERQKYFRSPVRKHLRFFLREFFWEVQISIFAVVVINGSWIDHMARCRKIQPVPCRPYLRRGPQWVFFLLSSLVIHQSL